MSESMNERIAIEINKELARGLASNFRKAAARLWKINNRIGVSLVWSASGGGLPPGPVVRVERWGFVAWVPLSFAASVDEIVDGSIDAAFKIDAHVIPNGLGPFGPGGKRPDDRTLRIDPPPAAT